MPLKKSHRERAGENRCWEFTAAVFHTSLSVDQEEQPERSDRNTRDFERSVLSFLLLLLTLTEVSLGRHYIAMFEATQNVMLKPTDSWRETLLDHRVMDLFFTVSTTFFSFFFLIIHFSRRFIFLDVLFFALKLLSFYSFFLFSYAFAHSIPAFSHPVYSSCFLFLLLSNNCL